MPGLVTNDGSIDKLWTRTVVCWAGFHIIQRRGALGQPRFSPPSIWGCAVCSVLLSPSLNHWSPACDTILMRFYMNHYKRFNYRTWLLWESYVNLIVIALCLQYMIVYNMLSLRGSYGNLWVQWSLLVYKTFMHTLNRLLAWTHTQCLVDVLAGSSQSE